MKYDFSAPMPETIEDIEKLAEINSKIKKSVISSLYFAFPSTCVDATGFEQLRTHVDKFVKFNDYIDLFSAVKENGFDFVYLLNSTKPLFFDKKYLNFQYKKLDNLITKLNGYGFNKYRVGNLQLLDYMQTNYPEIHLYATTSLEYKSLEQYSLFLELFPSVREIVPAVDLNKNFKLLKNLKKKFPNVTIELMVNEGCLYGCPLRYQHNIALPYHIQSKFLNNDLRKNLSFFNGNCTKVGFSKFHFNFINHNLIRPWEIKEYAEIGITNFKLVGRNSGPNVCKDYIGYHANYLAGVDDIKNIEDYPINKFNNYFIFHDLPYTVKEVKPYLPDIEHFKKYGHLCDSRCGVECKYCHNLAKKLKKYIDKNYPKKKET